MGFAVLHEYPRERSQGPSPFSNLGPGPAKVTVTFHWGFGLKASEKSATLEPATSESFYPGEQVIGWVKVDADQPVFPSGQTLAAPYLSPTPQLIPLTFYRAEGIKHEHYVRVAASAAETLLKKKP